MRTFEHRLRFIQQDRAQSNWAESLGMSEREFTALFTGPFPDTASLQLLRRVENANLNWLLSNNGEPFFVNHHLSGEAFSDTIQAKLEYKPWQVYLCSLAEHTMLILTHPAQVEYKGKTVDYQQLEIHVGPGSLALAEALHPSAEKGQVLIPHFGATEKKSIANGQLGTYGLMRNGVTLKTECHVALPDSLHFPDKHEAKDQADTILLKVLMALLEQCLAESGEELSADNRAKIISTLYSFAGQMKMTATDLTPALIRTAIQIMYEQNQ
ncbi:hypothetical protein [Photobacterium sp. R1]